MCSFSGILLCFPAASRRPVQEMGKKSKRRGGGGERGGGKRNAGVSNSRNHSGGDQLIASGRTLAAAADAITDTSSAALLRVPTPNSWKGIVSTNNIPDKCELCQSPFLDRTYEYFECCGKIVCPGCPLKPNYACSARDLRGEIRCTFCNRAASGWRTNLRNEANLGKPWAQFLLGIRCLVEGAPKESEKWLKRAALGGHPVAFEDLSDMYLKGEHVLCDLQLAYAFAKKGRSLHPHLTWRCGIYLAEIAKAHFNAGNNIEGTEILLEIAKEPGFRLRCLKENDEGAIDPFLCSDIATRLCSNKEYIISAEMNVKSFCHGHVESSISASISFFLCEKFALSKLWLDVACKTKSLYTYVDIATTGKKKTWPDYEKERDKIRSKLREMRNSCGGCGTALAGETRKYCRCCRTYCYCNEDCQKKHWGNGHQEECEEVEEHMRKILRAIRLGRFDSLCQSASK